MRAANGEIIASSDGYTTGASAEKVIKSVQTTRLAITPDSADSSVN